MREKSINATYRLLDAYYFIINSSAQKSTMVVCITVCPSEKLVTVAFKWIWLSRSIFCLYFPCSQPLGQIKQISSFVHVFLVSKRPYLFIPPPACLSRWGGWRQDINCWESIQGCKYTAVNILARRKVLQLLFDLFFVNHCCYKPFCYQTVPLG